MSDKNFAKLNNEIDSVRKQLENLINKKKITNQEVLEISRELDELIVVYQKLMMKRE